MSGTFSRISGPEQRTVTPLTGPTRSLRGGIMSYQSINSSRSIVVDQEDQDLLDNFHWAIRVIRKSVYAFRYIGSGHKTRKNVYLHQEIGKRMGIDGMVDHRDRNGLNNRRSNLRPCTHSQNMANANRHSNNSTGFRGVTRSRNKFRATIQVQGKMIRLGTFATAVDAAAAYNLAATKYFGEFAYQNK